MSAVENNNFQSDEEDIQAELDAIQGPEPFLDDEFEVQGLSASESFAEETLDDGVKNSAYSEKRNVSSAIDDLKKNLKIDLANGGKKTKLYIVAAMLVLLIFIAILVSIVNSVFVSETSPPAVKGLSPVTRTLDDVSNTNRLKNILSNDAKVVLTKPEAEYEQTQVGIAGYGEEKTSNAKLLSAIKILNRKINDSEVRTNSLISKLNNRMTSLGEDIGRSVSIKVASELSQITSQLSTLVNDSDQLEQVLLETRKELKSLVAEAEKIIDDRAKLTGFSLTGINSYGGKMEAIVNDGGNDVPVQQGSIYKGWRLSSMQMGKGATFCSISSLICTTLRVPGESL